MMHICKKMCLLWLQYCWVCMTTQEHLRLLTILGSAANLYCRVCMVSINTMSCMPLNLVKLLYKCDKRINPKRIGRPRNKDQALTQMSLIQLAPPHRQKQKQAQYGLREIYNPLFHLKVDFYRYSTATYVTY